MLTLEHSYNINRAYNVVVPKNNTISAGGISNGGFVGDTGYAVVNEKQKKKSVGK